MTTPATPHPTRPDPEDTCDDCGRPNTRWWVDSGLWNHVIRPQGETADEPMLCPVCFVVRAERVIVAPPSWQLLPDARWEPESVMRMCARIAGPERAR